MPASPFAGEVSNAQGRWETELTTKVMSLLQSPQFSDFVIVCQGRQWKVHRLVISSHSKYFETVVTQDFKEKVEARIDLSEADEPAVIDALVSYFYNMTYQTPKDASALLFEAKVFVAADKYFISLLSELAHEKLSKVGIDLIDNGQLTASLLAEAITLTYGNTLDQAKIRETIVSLAELFLAKNGGYAKEITQVMATVEEFGRDLEVDRYKKQTEFIYKYRSDCFYCDSQNFATATPLTQASINNYVCPWCGDPSARPQRLP